MANPNRRQRRAKLNEAQERLAQAIEQAKPYEILEAQLDLGFAYFNNRKYQQGLEAFDRAEQISQDLDDPHAEALVLGTQILAYQSIDRLPDAFKLSDQMISLGEQHMSAGIRADGLRFKGETLLESGKPTEAFEELRQALEAAQEAKDPKREMAVNATLGHLSLIIAVPDKAESYFSTAVELARQVQDPIAEAGYLGNLASVLAWRGDHNAALETYQKVLAAANRAELKELAANAHHQLAKIHIKLEQSAQALQHAQQGFDLVEANDLETAFSLIETLILSHYKMNQIEAAQDATQRAIKLAKDSRDRSKELQMLISLGESFLGAEQPEQAIDTYQQALALAKTLEKEIDQANLIGRLALARAELGQLEAAVAAHQEAIGLAEELNLKELEGDQRCLLAMSLNELGESETAHEQVQRAIAVFQSADLAAGAARASRLLEQLEHEAG